MPKRDPDEQRRFRMHVWGHNSHLGKTRMALANMQSIELSRSTTAETKQLAADIQVQLSNLLTALSERNDDDF